jgi:hypothetical protein
MPYANNNKKIMGKSCKHEDNKSSPKNEMKRSLRQVLKARREFVYLMETDFIETP